MLETVFASSTGVPGTAAIEGRYRYALTRLIAGHPGYTAGPLGGAADTVLFVMLNPSTADAHVDDPTLRRCMSFARGWGFGKLAVGNLYAWRSPKPEALVDAPDPVGPKNDEHLEDLVLDASLIVAAWGASEQVAPERALLVSLILEDTSAPLTCLELTADGHPAHPLYLNEDCEPEPFDHWRELYG